MKNNRLATICISTTIVLAASGMAQAGMWTLQFNPNDIFNYAISDDTRLNQQGTARYIDNAPTGRYYQTYNDGVDPRDRMDDATPEQDLQSVANILDWTATAGFQGVSHIQLWLSSGENVRRWGEKVVQIGYQSSLSASVNGEYDWTAKIDEHSWDADGHNPPYQPGTDEYGIAHFNTVLGGEGHQNALSPDFNLAEQLWSVTGEFYVDNNANGTYDAGDTDLVFGNQYTLWFSAAFNNWYCADAYGNNESGSFPMDGTLQATAVPVPGAVLLGILGLSVVGVKLRKFA